MGETGAIDDIVHRHASAIVSMDIAQIMNDLEPRAMAKLQQQGGGGTAIKIEAYELLGSRPDGDDWLYEVRYIGPQSFKVEVRWSRIGSDWKVVDADIIEKE